jgi:hypothetical protein
MAGTQPLLLLQNPPWRNVQEATEGCGGWERALAAMCEGVWGVTTLPVCEV